MSIGTNRIAKVIQIKDLGVTFEEKLTFAPHINNVISNCNKMYGAAHIFTIDIRCSRIMINVINTSSNRWILLKHLEVVWHKGTRIALCSPYQQYRPNCLIFPGRIWRLILLTFEQRRNLAAIIFLIKILKEETVSNHHTTIRYCMRDNLRSPNVFEVDRADVPRKSLLFNFMTLINGLRNIIDMFGQWYVALLYLSTSKSTSKWPAQ